MANSPTAMVPLSVNDLDQLIAVVTGARDRILGVGAGVIVDQLEDLRARLIDADRTLRESVGLPTD